MMGMVGGGDPNAQGGAAPGNGKSTITLTIDELIKLVKVFSGGAKDGTAPAAAPAAPASDPKVGEIHAMLQSMLGKQ
jgi:hypothetical protein